MWSLVFSSFSLMGRDASSDLLSLRCDGETMETASGAWTAWASKRQWDVQGVAVGGGERGRGEGCFHRGQMLCVRARCVRSCCLPACCSGSELLALLSYRCEHRPAPALSLGSDSGSTDGSARDPCRGPLCAPLKGFRACCRPHRVAEHCMQKKFHRSLTR